MSKDNIEILRDFRYEINTQRMKIRGLIGASNQELSRLDAMYESLDKTIGKMIEKKK